MQSLGTVHLRMLETTDLHVHLQPYDYFADRPAPDMGLVRLAELIDAARAEATNCLLFDNGDFLQGTPVGDFIAYERGLRDGDVHPVIGAMNALAFDAITLGNHEFNYGLDFLIRSLDGAAFPVVSANLATSLGATPLGDRTLVRPYVLLDWIVHDVLGQPHPIRIGVIGFAPPQVTLWEHQHLHGKLHARDIIETARAWVPEMRAAGADLILALAHTGIGAAEHSDGMENAARPLARQPGIDALMLGHTHLLFPGPPERGANMPRGIDPVHGTIEGKPAVMGGFWGSHLGVIDLLLQREAGEWRVLGTRSEVRGLHQHPDTRKRHEQPGTAAQLRAPGALLHGGQPAPVSHGASAPAMTQRTPLVRQAVAEAHRMTLASIRKPIGYTQVALHSYFALLGRSPALALVAEAQHNHVAERIAATGQHLPILSSVAPFKAGGRSGAGNFTDIPAGPLALLNIADLYVFPNLLAAVKLTGAELRDWLERSASVFSRIRPGARDVELMRAEAASYNFEIVFGLQYRLDLSQPARYHGDGTLANADTRRVSALTFSGRAVTDDAAFIVCTNNYRAYGAGHFAGTGPDRVVYNDSTITRDAVRRHVAERASAAPLLPSPVSLAPVAGATVLLHTGHGARAYLDDIGDLAPQVVSEDPDGFLTLRLDLSAPDGRAT